MNHPAQDQRPAPVEDTTKDTYTLEIEVEPYGGIPGIIRLKSFLKRALRDWRIRCRAIRPLGDDPGIGHATTPPAATTRQNAAGGDCGASTTNAGNTGRQGLP